MMCPFCGRVNLPGADGCARCANDLTQFTRPTGQDRVEAHILTDHVGEVLSRQFHTIPVGATLGLALQKMVDAEVGALMVLDADGKLVGIISERDFLRRVVGRVENYARQPLAPYMTREPETVQPDDSIAMALRKMDLGGYRHLPVVVDGRPMGVLSVRNVLRHVTRLV